MEGVGFEDYPGNDFLVILGPGCVVENTCISPPIFGLQGSPSKEAGEVRRGRNFWREVRGQGENAELLIVASGEGQTAVTNSPWVNYLLVCPCHSLVY